MTEHCISRCGFYCDLCPWGENFRKSIKTEDEFEQMRKEVKKYVGYTPLKNPCYTCLPTNEELPKGVKLPSRSCLIRQCTHYNEIENCAYCARYPCFQIIERHGTHSDMEEVKTQLGEEFNEQDFKKYYASFISPLQNLDAFRATLKKSQLVEPKPLPPLKDRIVIFPEEAESPNEENLHKVLSRLFKSDLGLEDFDVYAGNERWKNRRRTLATLLWTLGKSGTIKGSILKISAEKYMKEKHKKAPTMKVHFDTYSMLLKKQGIKLQFIPLADEDVYQLPMGYLRNKGWAVEMSFNKKAGGDSALLALVKFIEKLEKKYGNRAFGYFSKLDMRNL